MLQTKNLKYLRFQREYQGFIRTLKKQCVENYNSFFHSPRLGRVSGHAQKNILQEEK